MLTAAGRIGRRRPGFLVLTLQGSVLGSHASMGSERRVFRPASTVWHGQCVRFRGLLPRRPASTDDLPDGIAKGGAAGSRALKGGCRRFPDKRERQPISCFWG